MSESNTQNSFQRIVSDVKRLITLHIDYAKLTAAEKTTIILSSAAFYALVVLFAVLALVFLTLGVGWLLAQTIAPHFAFMIVAGFYVVLLVILLMLRRRLLINPISRFVSKLFLNSPEDEN